MPNLPKTLTAAALGLISSGAFAYGFGPVNAKSFLYEPLRAEVILRGAPDEASKASFKIASPEKHAEMGLPYPSFLKDARVTVERQAKYFRLFVATDKPIYDPNVRLLIEVSAENGKIYLPLTIMLDAAYAANLEPEMAASVPGAKSKSPKPGKAPASDKAPSPRKETRALPIPEASPKAKPAPAQSGAAPAPAKAAKPRASEPSIAPALPKQHAAAQGDSLTKRLDALEASHGKMRGEIDDIKSGQNEMRKEIVTMAGSLAELVQNLHDQKAGSAQTAKAAPKEPALALPSNNSPKALPPASSIDAVAEAKPAKADKPSLPEPSKAPAQEPAKAVKPSLPEPSKAPAQEPAKADKPALPDPSKAPAQEPAKADKPALPDPSKAPAQELSKPGKAFSPDAAKQIWPSEPSLPESHVDKAAPEQTAKSPDTSKIQPNPAAQADMPAPAETRPAPNPDEAAPVSAQLEAPKPAPEPPRIPAAAQQPVSASWSDGLLDWLATNLPLALGALGFAGVAAFAAKKLISRNSRDTGILTTSSNTLPFDDEFEATSAAPGEPAQVEKEAADKRLQDELNEIFSPSSSGFGAHETSLQSGGPALYASKATAGIPRQEEQEAPFLDFGAPFAPAAAAAPQIAPQETQPAPEPLSFGHDSAPDFNLTEIEHDLRMDEPESGSIDLGELPVLPEAEPAGSEPFASGLDFFASEQPAAQEPADPAGRPEGLAAIDFGSDVTFDFDLESEIGKTNDDSLLLSTFNNFEAKAAHADELSVSPAIPEGAGKLQLELACLYAQNGDVEGALSAIADVLNDIQMQEFHQEAARLQAIVEKMA